MFCGAGARFVLCEDDSTNAPLGLSPFSLYVALESRDEQSLAIRILLFFFLRVVLHGASRRGDSLFARGSSGDDFAGSLVRFYRFLSRRWGVYVDFMRLGAVNLDFLRIPVIRQTLRQDTLIRRSFAGWLADSRPPVHPPAVRSLLRSANRRQYFKLRRRLNISIPGPKQREVRIKSTSSTLFLHVPPPKLRTI